MRTPLRKWEAGSRHLSYPHYIGGDAMLPLGDTSSLQLSSQVNRMWEKWLFWEIQSICNCILYTYIFTDSDSLIHWMVLPFWCSNMLLLFQDKHTHSESCHREPTMQPSMYRRRIYRLYVRRPVSFLFQVPFHSQIVHQQFCNIPLTFPERAVWFVSGFFILKDGPLQQRARQAQRVPDNEEAQTQPTLGSCYLGLNGTARGWHGRW